MTLHLAFDSLLALILLWSAWQTLATPQLDRAVILYIVLGAGLTGTLLLDALAALRRKASCTAPTPPETQP
jgi:hypothetical protein